LFFLILYAGESNNYLTMTSSINDNYSFNLVVQVNIQIMI